MNSFIDKMLYAMSECVVLLRYVFFVVLSLCAYIDGYVFPEAELYGIYLIPITLAGFAFYNSIWIRMVITGIITWFRYKFAPGHHVPGMGTFGFEWFIFYIVTETMSGFMRYRMKENENILNVTLALAKSLDARDTYTAYHSENVAHYAFMIAKEMNLSKKQCDAIYLGGLLHDIGKIGVPESILMKPSRLTSDEYEAIKQHPVIGFNTLKHISLFLENGVLDMVLFHHECHDGTGYPAGLKGIQIPLVARIMAIADAFDAMTSSRVYRSDTNLGYAVDQIRKNIGIQFDPEIADIFLKILEREGTKMLTNRVASSQNIGLTKFKG